MKKSIYRVLNSQYYSRHLQQLHVILLIKKQLQAITSNIDNAKNVFPGLAQNVRDSVRFHPWVKLSYILKKARRHVKTYNQEV